MSQNSHEYQYFQNFFNHLNAENNGLLLNNRNFRPPASPDFEIFKKHLKFLYNYILKQDEAYNNVFVNRYDNTALNCNPITLNLAKLALEYQITNNESAYKILNDAQDSNLIDNQPLIELIQNKKNSTRFFNYLLTSVNLSLPLMLISYLLTSHFLISDPLLFAPILTLCVLFSLATQFYMHNSFQKSTTNLNQLEIFFENNQHLISHTATV